MAIEITEDLPGNGLVSAGLTDLARGETNTIEALLVTIGHPRLLALGFSLPYQLPESPERDLYQMLGNTPLVRNTTH